MIGKTTQEVFAMAEKMTSRKIQAMEMRSRIQSVALDLFDKEGFENVSVDEIAQAAGCSVGNIYHYFKSKDELVVHATELVDIAYARLEPMYLADTTRSGYEKLLDFVGQSLRVSVADSFLYKCFMQSIKYPEQGVLKKGAKRTYYRLLAELVEMCKREGSIAPQYKTDDVVEYLVTLHRGMLFEYRIYEGSFDLIGRGQAMAKLLLDGMKK